MAKGQIRKSKEKRKAKDPQSKKSGPKYLRDTSLQVGAPEKAKTRRGR